MGVAKHSRRVSAQLFRIRSGRKCWLANGPGRRVGAALLPKHNRWAAHNAREQPRPLPQPAPGRGPCCRVDPVCHARVRLAQLRCLCRVQGPSQLPSNKFHARPVRCRGQSSASELAAGAAPSLWPQMRMDRHQLGVWVQDQRRRDTGTVGKLFISKLARVQNVLRSRYPLQGRRLRDINFFVRHLHHGMHITHCKGFHVLQTCTRHESILNWTMYD